MAQTKEGAQKVAAKRAGISLEEYLSHIHADEKWCYKCRKWRSRKDFCKDTSRGDGLSSICNYCRRVNKPWKSHKGRVSTFKGKKHTAEAKRKMSEAKKGKPSKRKGIPRSLKTRKKISEAVRAIALKGKDCPAYKDGKVVERRGVRFSRAYKQWRYDVFTRDNFICQNCGDDRGGNLVAHHIKSFSDYPELRIDIDNGITLCKDCHKEIHNGKNNN